RTNQFLRGGERLRTGLLSRATLRLSDKSVLRINELTTLKIQPPPRFSNAPVLDLGAGSTYFFSREKPATVEFRTPLASGAIRGTEFHLAVAGDGRTVLSLLDGLVTLTNSSGGIELKSGEQGIVEAGKAPSRTAVIQAINVIQWCLYYPAVLDPAELGLSGEVQQAITPSLAYYRQSRSQLEAALRAAKSATAKSPNFGFAWARVAELEFSFGRTQRALTALEKALQLSPRNAEAISLKGFLLVAQNRVRKALTW